MPSKQITIEGGAGDRRCDPQYPRRYPYLSVGASKPRRLRLQLRTMPARPFARFHPKLYTYQLRSNQITHFRPAVLVPRTNLGWPKSEEVCWFGGQTLRGDPPTPKALELEGGKKRRLYADQ
jgi:hypothetical protein